MKFPNPRAWWRKLPKKTRVQVIASVLLVFAGTEILVLAPYVFEIAAMIDLFGLAFVFAAVSSSIRLCLDRIKWLFIQFLIRPATAVFRVIVAISDCGSKVPNDWLLWFLRADSFVGRV